LKYTLLEVRKDKRGGVLGGIKRKNWGTQTIRYQEAEGLVRIGTHTLSHPT
jgi:hypothetical protein